MLCTYCGAEIVRKQAVANVAGAGVENLLALAETAQNAGEHEEALQYYNRVLETDITNAAAWLGKGTSFFEMATLEDLRVSETLDIFEKAVEHADDPLATKRAVAARLHRRVWHLRSKALLAGSGTAGVTVGKLRARSSHIIETARQFLALEQALARAAEYDPSNPEMSVGDDGRATVLDTAIGLLQWFDRELTDNMFADTHADTVAKARSLRAGYVAKKKALDSEYVEPTIRMSGEQKRAIIAQFMNEKDGEKKGQAKVAAVGKLQVLLGLVIILGLVAIAFAIS